MSLLRYASRFLRTSVFLGAEWLALGCSSTSKEPPAIELRSRGAALQESSLEVWARVEAPDDAAWVKPRIYVKNRGTTPLSSFLVDFYFTEPPTASPVVEDWHTPASTPQIEVLGDNQYRLVYDYANVTLAPGAVVPDSAGSVVGLHHSDYSDWFKADDYSYQGLTSSFSLAENIVVRGQDGTVLYGAPPPMPQGSTPDGNGASGSGGTPGAAEPSIGFYVQWPSEHSLDQLVFGSNEMLQIRDGVQLESSVGSSRPIAANLGAGLLEVGQQAQTGTLFGAGNVTTLRGAQVHGDIIATGSYTAQTGTAVSGTYPPPNRVFETSRTHFRVTFPAEKAAVSMDRLVALVPGAYSALSITNGQEVTLTGPGRYYFDTLGIEPEGTLRLRNSAGGIEIFVRSGDSFVRGDWKLDEPRQANILLAHAGEGNVSVARPFRGTLVAPWANVELATLSAGEWHEGSFFARTIVQHPHTAVRLRPYVADCSWFASTCSETLGCSLPDADSDSLSDCQEQGDGSPWTDPQVPNGIRMRWDDECSFSTNEICPAIDTPSEVNACLGPQPQEEVDATAGFSWHDVTTTSICDVGYGFIPPFSSCSDTWTLHAQGFLWVPQDGYECFSVAGDDQTSCGALFLAEQPEALLSGAGSTCYWLTQGAHEIRWFRAAAPGSTGDFGVDHCSGGAEPCEPTSTIRIDVLRPERCGAGECTSYCPCGEGGGACARDADCTEGLVCTAGLATQNGLPEGSSTCLLPLCTTDPTDPRCHKRPPSCETNSDCTRGKCLDAGYKYGFAAGGKLCFDDDFCSSSAGADYCGAADALCGLCECAPDCSGKACGDDPSDGCGGYCPEICGPGEQGCTHSASCSGDELCLQGQCLPPICGTTDCNDAECGSSCDTCTPLCLGRVCGIDLRCGVSCGTCGEGSSCFNGICKLSPSAPRTDVPDSPTAGRKVTPAIGSIPGTLTVSPTGEARYHVPIALPPARNGHSPDLALVYAGNRAPGIAGVGWTVSGLSAIARCAKTTAIDGWPEPVRGDDATDAYCLDGQRLVLTSGSAGSDGATYRTRTEAFVDVTYHRLEGANGFQNTYWTMRTKSGEFREYGKRYRTYMGLAGATAVPRVWPVDRVVARDGAARTYEYQCDGLTTLGGGYCVVELLPRAIHYGGFAPYTEQGLATEATHSSTHTIEFSYEPRQNRQMFVVGPEAYSSLERRLQHVRVRHGGSTMLGYWLSYSESTRGYGDLLGSVEQCAILDGEIYEETCMPPLLFEYEDDAGPTFEEPISALNPFWGDDFGGGFSVLDVKVREEQKNIKPTIMLDLNGDSTPDFVHPGPAGAWWVTLGNNYDEHPPVRAERVEGKMKCIGPASVAAFADFASEGNQALVDTCTIHPSGEVNYYELNPHRTTGPLLERRLYLPGILDKHVEQVLPIDINLDGDTELIACDVNGPVMIWTRKQPGSAYQGYPIPPVPRHGRWHSANACNWNNNQLERPSPLFMDTDGDGTPDLQIQAPQGSQALHFRYQDDELVAEWTHVGLDVESDAPTSLLAGPFRAMDVNGDGLQDILEHRAFLLGPQKDSDGLEIRVKSTDADHLGIDVYAWMNRAGSFSDLYSNLPAVELGYDHIEPTAPQGSPWWRGVTAKFFEISRIADLNLSGRGGIISFVQEQAHRGWHYVTADSVFDPRQRKLLWRAERIPSLPSEETWTTSAMVPMFADFNGDGVTDALLQRGYTSQRDFNVRLYLGRNPLRRLLKKVTDGLGNQTLITHSVYKDYLVNTECGPLPYTRCAARGGSVVTRLLTKNASQVDDATAEEGHTFFSYYDRRAARGGGGSLGFGKRIQSDYQPGLSLPIRTVTETYDNGSTGPAPEFPFAGRLLRRVTETADETNGLSDLNAPTSATSRPITRFRTIESFTYQEMTSDAGRPFVVLTEQEERRYQVIGGEQHELSRTIERFHDATGANGFDSYGNLHYRNKQTTAPSTDGTTARVIVTVEEHTQYYPNGKRSSDGPTVPTRWDPGLVQQHSVTSGGITRKYDFEYTESYGLRRSSSRLVNGELHRISSEYDNVNNLRRVIEEGSGTVRQSTIEYDEAQLRPVRATGPTGMVAAVELDTATGQLRSEVDANGVGAVHVYDLFGRRIQTISATGIETVTLTASTEPTGLYQVTNTITDGLSTQSTTTHFDSRGHDVLTRSLGLDGVWLTQAKVYDALGRLRLKELPHPEGDEAATGVTQYHYTPLGSLERVSAPGDKGKAPVIERYEYATRYTSDVSDVPVLSPDSVLTYVARKIDADGKVNTTYSGPLQEPLVRRQGEGEEAINTRIAYGAFGDMTRYQTSNNTLTVAHDTWGRATSVSDSDVGTIRYSYDALDRLLTMVEAEGHHSRYEYDALDRVINASHWDADGALEASEEFVFDCDPTQRDANGRCVADAQNSLGRLIQATRSQVGSPSTTERVFYEAPPSDGDYLKNRALVERIQLQTADRTLESSYEYYNGSNRVAVQHYPPTASGQLIGVQYCYDDLGTKTHAFPLEAITPCDAPESASEEPYWKRTGTQKGIAANSYQLGNGVNVTLDLDPVTFRLSGHQVEGPAGGSGPTLTFQYDYEPGGRLKSSTRSSGGSETTKAFNYRKSGVLDSIVTNNQPTHVPGYDEAWRLAGTEKLGTFHYDDGDDDPGNNRLKSVTPPGAAGPTTFFEYDGRGNQRRRTGEHIPGGEQVITYNTFNLPSTINYFESGEARRVAFDYSASGERVHTERSDREIWHFGGIYEHEERTGDPDLSEEDRYWIFADGKRIAQINRSRRAEEPWSESIWYYHVDRLGSVVALSDNTGNTTHEFEYDTYGTPLQELPIPYGYTGHRHEQYLGLIDMGARFYDPVFATFLSPDPESPLSGGSPRMNRYGYVGYDPINFVDPNGRFVFLAPALAAFGISLIVNTTVGLIDGDWDSNDTARLLMGGIAAFAGGAVSGLLLQFSYASAVEAAVAASAIGGATYGLGAGVRSGASWDQVVGSALQGGVIGALSSAFGASGNAGIVALDVFESRYALAASELLLTSGASAGVSALSGGDVDWGSLSVQLAVSTVGAFHSAYELTQADIDRNHQTAQGAGRAAKAASDRADAAARARHINAFLASASTAAGSSASLLDRYPNAIACLYCEAIGMNIYDPQQFPKNYARTQGLGAAASLFFLTGAALLPVEVAGYAAWFAARGAPKLLEAGKLAKHHLFPQQFRKFFSSRGINIDQFTVTLGHNTSHLKGVHGKGLGNMPGGWNKRWADFIEANPNATAKDIYQFGGKLMDEFGLSHIPIQPY